MSIISPYRLIGMKIRIRLVLILVKKQLLVDSLYYMMKVKRRKMLWPIKNRLIKYGNDNYKQIINLLILLVYYLLNLIYDIPQNSFYFLHVILSKLFLLLKKNFINVFELTLYSIYE